MSAEVNYPEVMRAVRVGKGLGLVVPQPCERCGATKRVHGHHEDYARPIDLMWLCGSCHMRRHGEIGQQRRDEEAARFLAGWSLDATVKRRGEWNERVWSGEFGHPYQNWRPPELRQAESSQGWTLDDLRRAVKAHGLLRRRNYHSCGILA